MNFNPSKITIGGMSIRNPDNISQILIGTNLLMGRGISAKKNQGVGQQNADQVKIFAPVSVIIDYDGSDNAGFKNNH